MTPTWGGDERGEHREARDHREREHDERDALRERGRLAPAGDTVEHQEQRRPHVHEAEEVVEQADHMDVQGLHGVELKGSEQERHCERIGERDEHERHDARRARERGALVAGKEAAPHETGQAVVHQLDGEVHQQHGNVRIVARIRDEVAERAPQDTRDAEEEPEHGPHAGGGAYLRGPVESGDHEEGLEHDEVRDGARQAGEHRAAQAAAARKAASPGHRKCPRSRSSRGPRAPQAPRRRAPAGHRST